MGRPVRGRRQCSGAEGGGGIGSGDEGALLLGTKEAFGAKFEVFGVNIDELHCVGLRWRTVKRKKKGERGRRGA